MKLEWNPRKAASNLRKHAIDFADVATVLHDPLCLTIGDDLLDEDRYATIGMDALGRVLVAVHAHRDGSIRLISARKATRGERRQYEEKR